MQIVIFLPMPAAPGGPSFVFLPMPFLSVPAVTTSTRMYVIYSSLLLLVFCRLHTVLIFVCANCDNLYYIIFLTLLAVTTCSGYADCYISTYASCAGWTKFCFSTYANCVRLWTCARYAECYVSTYASSDNLCQVCGLLYFYLCQLWRHVPGMWIIIFLPRCQL